MSQRCRAWKAAWKWGVLHTDSSIVCMYPKKGSWVGHSRPTCSHYQILPWLHSQVWCNLGLSLETGSIFRVEMACVYWRMALWQKKPQLPWKCWPSHWPHHETLLSTSTARAASTSGLIATPDNLLLQHEMPSVPAGKHPQAGCSLRLQNSQWTAGFWPRVCPWLSWQDRAQKSLAKKEFPNSVTARQELWLWLPDHGIDGRKIDRNLLNF